MRTIVPTYKKKVVGISLMTLLLALLPLLVFSQTKRALVIGLGEQEDKHWRKINGDKDVLLVVSMLQSNGYSHINALVNKNATKDGIVKAFENLSLQCKRGDVVYIHFSGHGQRMTDLDGDEGENGLDECWIPYDAYTEYCEQDKGEKHLTDDEIFPLLSAIKDCIGDEGKMMVVVDACHSEDSTKGNDDEVVRGGYKRFEPYFEKKDVEVSPKSTNDKKERWLVLSACKSYQLNYEMKEPKVGKLTYALWLLNKEGGVSMDKVEDFFFHNQSNSSQTPILSGEKENYKISIFLR